MKKGITILIIVIAAEILFFALLSAWATSPTSRSSEAIAPDHNKCGNLNLLKISDANVNIYLSKNGNRYHMGPISADESSEIGLKLEENSDWFYTYTTGQAEGEEATINYIISLDDELPVPVIDENDRIVGNEDSIGKNLKLMPIKFSGYTPLVCLNGDGTVFVDAIDKKMLDLEPGLYSSLEIYPEDAKGNLGEKLEAPEWMMLPYRQELQIYWNDRFGPMAHALRTTAKYSAYQYNGKDDVFTLESIGTEELNQTEFQVFELSELEPGYYAMLNNNGDKVYSVFYRADN